LLRCAAAALVQPWLWVLPAVAASQRYPHRSTACVEQISGSKRWVSTPRFVREHRSLVRYRPLANHILAFKQLAAPLQSTSIHIAFA